MSLCFANHILFDVDGPSRARVEFDAAAKLSENQIRAIALPSGPVAQLGARFHGMEEVVGSIPTRSTKSSIMEGELPLQSWLRRSQQASPAL